MRSRCVSGLCNRAYRAVNFTGDKPWTLRAIAAVASLLLLTAAVLAADISSPFTDEDRDYWAFRPVARPAAPAVGAIGHVRNPIDAFILARLEKADIAPSPEADQLTLLRRASYDILGLPPNAIDADAFLADTGAGAYERLIDRLLASPQYGEHWARYWLDLVRYADSDGYNADAARPDAWRYRDYVIRALNDDKPYDQFIAEQLAGDELAPDDPDALIATGFLRHWPYEWNQRNVPLQWETILNDLTDVTGQVFMGLTVGCARCHDHKFDPILQADYYRLQAFFTPFQPRDKFVLASELDRQQYETRLKVWEAATEDLRAEIDQLEAPYREKAAAPDKEKFPRETQALIDKPAESRTPLEEQLATLAGRQLVVTPTMMGVALEKKDDKKRWEALRKELEKFEKLRPRTPSAMLAGDVGRYAPPTVIPGKQVEVSPGFLTVLSPAPADIEPLTTGVESTGRRAALARWLTRADNPLTARVMVNRIWQHHFGKGIAGSPSDFGLQGEPPTHPELLDWLAAEFVSSGWSLKHLHRLMLTSATYRQAAVVATDAPGREKDPPNELLWRMPIRRLAAEDLRDAMLAVSGELDARSGGPAVYPEVSEGTDERGYRQPDSSQTEQNRRSVYLAVKRNLRLPLLQAFDVPDTHESCARRSVTTTAPQALILINSQWSIARAQAFAARVLRESPSENRERIATAYRLALSREPFEDELSATEQFLRQQTELVEQRIANDEEVAQPSMTIEGIAKPQAAAWVDLCHLLLNSNEFLYID